MKTFYLTDSGKVRDHNEDSVTIVNNEEGNYLMAIADGMGGHSAGEVASNIAIGYLGRHFQDTFHKCSPALQKALPSEPLRVSERFQIQGKDSVLPFQDIFQACQQVQNL